MRLPSKVLKDIWTYFHHWDVNGPGHSGDLLRQLSRKQYVFPLQNDSILEQIIPFWNKSFWSGMNCSGVIPEIGYETYSQNSGSLFVSRKNLHFLHSSQSYDGWKSKVSKKGLNFKKSTPKPPKIDLFRAKTISPTYLGINLGIYDQKVQIWTGPQKDKWT